MQGLEGVVVAETRVSGVDGEEGRLVIRGRTVGACAPLDFESTVALLWDDAMPTPERRRELRAGLGAARSAAAKRPGPPRRDDVMDYLRAGVGGLEASGDDWDRLHVTATIAVLTARWWRETARLPPLPSPDPDAPHAADLLRLLGSPASATRVRALEGYLGTVVDHGFNASTFAARVTASTGSDLVSAVTAAIGTLKGPLHGGAPGPVLDMLDAVKGRDPDAWLLDEVRAGRRIMGMGHRVYRVRDPRAAALEETAETLAASGAPTRLDEARDLERAAQRVLERAKPDRRLRANVEFFTAVLLDALGLDRRLFPAIFACSRVVGWCAHVAEQRAEGRLIRPSARYVGEPATSRP